jgi:hypothetical protein
MSSQGHSTTWNITQVALFNAQDAENEFGWPFDTSKYRFIDILKVAF